MHIFSRLIPLGFLATLFLLAGCAASGVRDQYGRPKLERLPASAAASRPARLTLDDLVAMERAGSSPQEIVGRIRSAGQRFDMDVPQQKQLRAAGASSALIDALVTAEAEARNTDRLTREADKAAAQRESARRYTVYRDYYYRDYYYPYWGRFHPFVGYGSHGGWHGGAGWYW